MHIQHVQHVHHFLPLAPLLLKVLWPLATLPVLGGALERLTPRRSTFEELIDEHRQLLHRVAYRMARNADEAEDLVQETVVDAYRSFHKFQPGTRFDRWIMAVLTHNFIDRQRSRRRVRLESLDQQGEEQGPLELPDCRMDPARRIEEHLDEPVQRALSELNAEYRTAVVLCDIDCLSYQEIAATLQVPIGTVRSRINRGRGILKKKLAEFARARYRL